MHGRTLAAKRESATDGANAADKLDNENACPAENAHPFEHAFDMRNAATRGLRAKTMGEPRGQANEAHTINDCEEVSHPTMRAVDGDDRLAQPLRPLEPFLENNGRDTCKNPDEGRSAKLDPAAGEPHRRATLFR